MFIAKLYTNGQQPTKIVELHAPDLWHAHTECGRVKHVCKHPTFPLLVRGASVQHLRSLNIKMVWLIRSVKAQKTTNIKTKRNVKVKSNALNHVFVYEQIILYNFDSYYLFTIFKNNKIRNEIRYQCHRNIPNISVKILIEPVYSILSI